jgi:hypothetical protein
MLQKHFLIEQTSFSFYHIESLLFLQDQNSEREREKTQTESKRVGGQSLFCA